jgi:5-methylcytosine-specific restriction endonuclease McrA
MSNKKCICCSTPTANQKYCSRSCAAKINNKIPKRKKTKYYCENCKKECEYRRKYCELCFKHCTTPDFTLQEAVYEKHHRSSAYALIRSRARLTDKAKRITACEKCGYDKHVEVCHIKPISDFSPNTKLSEINSETNLIILCPNCHWEFDHN